MYIVLYHITVISLSIVSPLSIALSIIIICTRSRRCTYLQGARRDLTSFRRRVGQQDPPPPQAPLAHQSCMSAVCANGSSRTGWGCSTGKCSSASETRSVVRDRIVASSVRRQTAELSMALCAQHAAIREAWRLRFDTDFMSVSDIDAKNEVFRAVRRASAPTAETRTGLFWNYGRL